MGLPARQSMTVEEHLAFERAQAERHDYDRGAVVLQAGGSQQHAVIAVNIASGLHQRLRSRDCTVYGSDMRIGMPSIPHYVYPDVSVACGASEFHDGHRDVLLNPILVIEVLSPSTERRDRGKKFQDYQRIPSFQEYVLVAQDAVLVEHYLRQSESNWTIEVLTDRGATLQPRSVGCALPLAEIYEKVPLPDETAPEGS